MRRPAVGNRMAVTAATILVAAGLSASLLLSPGDAGGAVPDCATAPNVRSWDGPASGNWGTATNWTSNVLPGPDEVACIGDANVTFDLVAAEVDAVVSGPNGTLTWPGGSRLTLSPTSGEQSQVANLAGNAAHVAGTGDMIVTKSLATTGSATFAGDADSTLTLAASVGSNASVASLRVDGRTLVVADGVTVTQSAGGGVTSDNGGSIENAGRWHAAGDGSVLSPGTAPGVFRNLPTGVVAKTGGTGSTRLGPFDNRGLIENQTTGTISLVGSGSTSAGSLVTGPGTIEFEPGTYAIAGSVSGEGTIRGGTTVTFSGTYSARRTEITGGGARVAFDTPSPQTLPQLVAGQSTIVAGSADLVVTELFDCRCRIEGADGSRFTLAASVGANATLAGISLDRRTFAVSDGVTVSQTSGGNGFNGASVENAGVWTGDTTLIGLSVFRNTATGIVRKTAGPTFSQIGSSVVNDGLIENQTANVLALGPFVLDAPGAVAVLSVSASPVLSGSGRLSPAFVHGEGLVAPGSSPGTIEVIGVPGSWELRNNARLAIEIGGTGPGEFDKLVLPGSFTLPPRFTTLVLSNLPGYEPTPGDEFAIVDAGSVTGTFETVTGTNLGNGLSFQVTYEADRIVVTVTGTPVNARPDAVNDELTVAEDSGATSIDVLANDTDPDGDPLEVVANAQPANGSAACTSSECTYTPDPNFNGTDSFTYRIADPIGNTDTATVNVTVTPVNDDPIAVDDVFDVGQGSADNDLDVLANDGDVDGDALQVRAVADPANGSAAVAPGGGSVVYTPDPGYSGPDSFTYTIEDGNGGSATATVSVTVSAPQTGTIEVVLDAQPDDGLDVPFGVLRNGQLLDPFSLDDDGDGTLPASTLLGPLDLTLGTDYLIAFGSLPAGWTLTAIDCNETPIDTNLASHEVRLQLDPGDTIQCTFTIATGFIEVVLDAQPDDGLDVPFGVLRNGQLLDPFSLDDDGDPTLPASRLLGPLDLTLGSDYRIFFGDLPAGWTLTSIDCNETPIDTNLASHEVRLQLDPGDTIRCTFTIATGFIEVVLDSQPDDGLDVPFGVLRNGQSLDPVSLDDDGDPTLPASRLLGPLDLTLGSDYRIFFGSLPAGWTLTSIDCDETPIDTNLASHEVRLQLDPGDTIQCTFTIEGQIAAVTVVKELVPSDDPGLFDLLLIGPGTPNGMAAEVENVGDGGTLGPINVAASPAFGSYRVEEEDNAPASPALSEYEISITCVEDPADGTSPNSPQSANGPSLTNLEVRAGEAWTCTITNTRRPNRTPDAVDDSASVANVPGTVVLIDVFANDSDPDGDSLTFIGSTPAQQGSRSCTSNGICTYTVAPNSAGTDSFTYSISDGNGGADQATVVITLTPALLAGKITPLGTGCSAYRNGAAGDLGELQYRTLPLAGRPILIVSPLNLRYFAQVTVPAGSFAIQIGQSRSPASPNFATLAPLAPTLRRLDCSRNTAVTASTSGGNVTFSGSVGTPTTFILDVPYTAATLLGRPSLNLSVTYTFQAKVNGASSEPSAAKILLRPRP